MPAVTTRRNSAGLRAISKTRDDYARAALRRIIADVNEHYVGLLESRLGIKSRNAAVLRHCVEHGLAVDLSWWV